MVRRLTRMEERRTLAVAAAVCVLGSALLAVSFGQDAGFDAKNYHWYAGYQLLHGRIDVDMGPAQIQGWFNPLIHLPLWFAGRIAGPAAACALLGALHGLAPLLVFLLGCRMLRGRAECRVVTALAATAALVGFVGPITLSGLGTSSGDPLIPFFVVGGLLALPDDTNRKRLLLSGGLIGLAVGLKPTAGIYAVGLTFSWLLLPPTPGRRALPWWLGGVAAGFALAAGPWMAFLLIRYGNPVFPLFNDVFQSPWAQDFSYAEDRLLPRSTREARLFWWYIARGGTFGWEVPFADARLLLLGSLGIVTAARSAVGRSIPPFPRFVVVALLVAAVLWQTSSSVYRYLGAVEVLTPLLAATVFLGPRIRPLRLAVLLIVWIGIGLSVRVPHLQRIPFADHPSPYGVEFPEPIPPDAVVLIAGTDALSYLVPEMPETVRVLRLYSSLHTHTDALRTTGAIADILTIHEGPLYFLEGPNPTVGAEVLDLLGVRPTTCMWVKTRVDPEVTLCRLALDRD